MIEDWGKITLEGLEKSWQAILNFLPKLIGALIVFLFGWLVAEFFGKLVAEILRKLKIDRAFQKTGWQEALERAEIKISPSSFIGQIIKWILVIVFLMIAVEILGFYQFSQFLARIVNWMPNLIVAVAIFIVAIILADLLEKIVKVSLKKTGIFFAGFLGALVKGAIYFFALFAILYQLGVAQEIVKAIVYGIVFAISLALGLSFGLGGKEEASQILKEIRKKISEK